MPPVSLRRRPRALYRYLYYLTYYLRTRTGRKRPLLGGIKLTHDCNLTCRHCPFWQRRGQSLSYDQTVEAMRVLFAWGVRLMIFEGGEPFLWQDGEYTIREVVREAKKYFFSVGITTNGTFPLEAEADIIWVSIDGLAETHNRVRGPVFDRVIQNIRQASHPRVFAHITINSLNAGEIPDLVSFLAPMVKGITIQFHYPYGNEEGTELFLPVAQRPAVLEKLIRLKKQGLPIADSVACLEALKDNTWTCRPWMIASADPDGKLTHGCYVKERGTINCEQCGFAANAEISLAYGGRMGAMRLASKIFK